MLAEDGLISYRGFDHWQQKVGSALGKLGRERQKGDQDSAREGVSDVSLECEENSCDG
jgi:hypothetical protein